MPDYQNIEIKARSRNAGPIRDYLLAQGAAFRGIDEQTDTYFHAPVGRLKLREGQIENNLIFYRRPDKPGPKQSDFHLVPIPPDSGLKALLTDCLGIKVIVKKRREIYFLENVKFHIDEVDGLGMFVEIEAGNLGNEKTTEELNAQCKFYLLALGIKESDLIDRSYSDLLMEKINITA